MLIRKKAATIYDIARLAQVSVSTVSRVLNGHTTVNEALRERVEAAMRDLRFRPNRIAQTLYHRRSNTLGCVLPDITNPYFAELFLQLEVTAFEQGYTTILGNTASEREYERTYLRTFVERQVDGLLLLGGLTNELELPAQDLQLLQDTVDRFPVVTVNGQLPGLSTAPSVSSDEAQGMRMLLDFLRSRGHTEVAFLGGRSDVTSTLEKLETYRALYPGHPPEWVQLTGFTVQSGEQAFAAMLDAARQPTAAVCINDLTAAGVLRAAAQSGVRVPQDFSVTGFDDTFLAQVISPALTTVNHNYAELARQALGVMTRAIGGDLSVPALRVPPLLIERASVQPRTPAVSHEL